MRKWIVTFTWEQEIEADDEGMALIEADSDFNFMAEARATEIEPYEGDDN